jgi:protein-arginine deiminase
MTRTVKKEGVLTPTTDEKRLLVAMDEKPKFRLHVDADRDGTVDDDPNGLDKWEPGKGRKGAIVLVNNNGVGNPAAGPNLPPAKVDHEDDVVNGAADVIDLTPLDIRRTGPTPPPGYKVVLSIAAEHAAHIRIFDTRTAAGKEVLGPTKGNEVAKPSKRKTYELPDLNAGKLELGVEAIHYAGTYNALPFDGCIMLTLTTFDGATEVDTHQALFRVAPWIMFNHFDTPEQVYVLLDLPDNGPLVSTLTVAATAAGAKVTPIEGNFYRYDPWMQDIMEFGFSERPGREPLRNVLETPRGRGLSEMPKNELLSAELGYLLPAERADTLGSASTLNSGGNLECTPPHKGIGGKNYPLGRIYYSPALDYDPIATAAQRTDASVLAPGYVEFLKAQKIQDPFTVDAAWLAVGHVDEFVSFVPHDCPRGFKVLIASPRLGMALARSSVKNGARMLIGRTYPRNASLAEIAVADLFSNGFDFGFGYKMSAHEFEVHNNNCQRRIDDARAKLSAEMSLDSTDFAEVPILYVAESAGFGIYARSDALTGGMVNMVVLGKHCIVPEASGPTVGGRDDFQENLRETLTKWGLTVTFVDTWNYYHLAKGEVHCGTNTLRKSIATVKWWEIDL